MALADLCYRCPACGHDPMAGKGDRAWCPSCGLRVQRRRGGIFTTRPGHRPRAAQAPTLAQPMEPRDGAERRVWTRAGADGCGGGTVARGAEDVGFHTVDEDFHGDRRSKALSHIRYLLAGGEVVVSEFDQFAKCAGAYAPGGQAEEVGGVEGGH